MDISWRILLGFEHENWVDHGFPLRPGFLFLLQDILLLLGCSLPSGSLGCGSRLAPLQSLGNVRLLQEGSVGRVFPQQRVTSNTVEVSVECILFVLLWSSKLGNIKTSAITHKPLFVRFSTRKQNATSLQGARFKRNIVADWPFLQPQGKFEVSIIKIFPWSFTRLTLPERGTSCLWPLKLWVFRPWSWMLRRLLMRCRGRQNPVWGEGERWYRRSGTLPTCTCTGPVKSKQEKRQFVLVKDNGQFTDQTRYKQLFAASEF